MGTVSLDTLTISSLGMKDIFFVKSDSSGNFLWAKSYGSSGEDLGYDIDVVDNDMIYFCGSFTGNSTFGSETVTSNGANDLFVACSNNSGNIYWLKHNGGVGDDFARSVKGISKTTCFVGGGYSSLVAFDNFNYLSNGNLDFFLGKIIAPVPFVPQLEKRNSFAVYPNPTSVGNNIVVDINAGIQEVILMELIDRMGAVVIKQTNSVVGSPIQFSVPLISNGLYFLKISLKNDMPLMGKIMIEN